jgi:putative spermidine/putrescine transport system permease protein
LGIARSAPRSRALLTILFLGPVVTPAIVLAVALYSLARATGLVSTMTALVVAHTVLALPFVVLNVGVSLDALDRRLTMAAAGLGASEFRVFRTVTLPLIMPGVAGGAVFAFVTSFDEVVLSIFLAGPTVKTLPVRIWEEIRVEYTPVVAVGATLMLALALIAGTTSRLVGRRK